MAKWVSILERGRRLLVFQSSLGGALVSVKVEDDLLGSAVQDKDHIGFVLLLSLVTGTRATNVCFG